MKGILFSIILLILTPAHILAADFYLYLDNCKSTVGYLVKSKDSIKTLDFDGMLIVCNRGSHNTIKCETEFFDKQKGIKAEYFVEIDSPLILTFTDAMRSDYFMIDLGQRTATMHTRLIGENFVGSKICTGIYMTESERKLLDEKKLRN